ncbi:MAG: hypothetical protein HYY17_17100 [Planctomycetes bacterium]|nr:hypothetical protein [Planctomycetota bacterium]
MTLPLPPRSIIRCDAATAQDVHDQLTSVIAGHPQATTTYRFYEEIDTWLGPWGSGGYPIGYGKFYNIAFSTNEHLRGNPTAAHWVWRTTIYLQEALRDWVVARVRDCTIGSVTEAQLRRAAFDSHPAAYDRGGLATVILAAPEMIPIIATIPGAEFSPGSENFGATIRQVFVTLERVAPQVVGGGLAALAGPAHTGVLRRAMDMDRRRMLGEMAISRELADLRRTIESGRVDHIPWLDAIIARLNAREFPDQGFARAAREVVAAAQARRRWVAEYYRGMSFHPSGVYLRR